MKQKKIKSFKHNEPPIQNMIMRMVDIRREKIISSGKGGVEVVIASENPVQRFDETRGEVMNEILLMDGVKFRTNRMQLPIVDSHDRSTVRNVLGSVQNIRIEGDQLIGDAVFAQDEESQIAYQKLLDGHLTDFSITAQPVNGQYIRRGDSININGKLIEGPAQIINEWIPTDASLVATGADETSTVRKLLRSYDINSHRSITRMLDESFKEALVAMGMPEQISDSQEALTWALGVLSAAKQGMEIEEEDIAEGVAEIASAEHTPMEEVKSQEEVKPEEVMKQEMSEEDKKDMVMNAVNRAIKADNKRRKEIVSLCEKAGIERAQADKWCDDNVNVGVVRTFILEKLMNNKPIGSGSRIEFVADGQDKFNAALKDGLVQRCLKSINPRNQYKGAAGSESFANMNLLRMAEEVLRRGNIDTTRMTQRDIAMCAMGHRPTIDRLANAGIIRAGEAYHTTGTFPALMLDAANKSLLAGYDEAVYTWSMWARQAPSVADFKNINRIRFSESPDLEMVPESHDYKEGVFSDQKESYKVEKFGRIFTVSWETVVNDDLDALSRVPQMHGNAARRTQNKKVYEVLTANALMSDGVALFGSHASGTNLSGSSADPSVATLNAAFAAMMKQKGLNSDVTLNIQPRYLIVPVALSATAMQLVGSIADPLAGGSTTTGNSNTLNIYGPNGSRPLQVVAEPQLDANSTAAWYLASDTNQIDTVELTFLQGEESPVLETEWDFDKDVYKYKVRQTFGVKAIDWRGLYKHFTS